MSCTVNHQNDACRRVEKNNQEDGDTWEQIRTPYSRVLTALWSIVEGLPMTPILRGNPRLGSRTPDRSKRSLSSPSSGSCAQMKLCGHQLGAAAAVEGRNHADAATQLPQIETISSLTGMLPRIARITQPLPRSRGYNPQTLTLHLLINQHLAFFKVSGFAQRGTKNLPSFGAIR